MKTNRFLSILTLASVLFLTACDSSDPDASGGEIVAQRAADIPSDPITGIGSDGRPVGQNAFTFFSLRSGQIVANADSASTGWDLAFKGTTILVNGGTSGPGNGAAQVLEGLFDEVKEAPADGWAQDGANGPAIPTGSGNGWYSYNPATQTVLPVPGRVLLIRTADGRFAKVSMVSYYQGAPASPSNESTSRFLTFDYVFQPDGSRMLD